MTIATDQSQWVRRKEAARIVGTRATTIAKVLKAENVRRRILPGGVLPEYYRPDLERIRAEFSTGETIR
jgi:hypothetical protein